MANPHPVTYDKEFARKVAALSIRDVLALSRISAVIKPEWVENQIVADVVDVAINYFKKFQKKPTRLVLRKECGRDVMESAAVQRLWRIDISDKEFVLDHLSNFARKCAIRAAVLDCAKLIKDEEDVDYVGIVSQAVQTGTDFGDMGMSLADLPSRLNYYALGENTSDLIPTGMAHIDRVMHGLGPGELGIFMGPTGSGKSFALMNVGLNAVIGSGRFKVVHFTFELSERKLMRRYDKCISGKHHALLATAPKDFIKELKKQHLLKVHGDVRVKHYPNKTCTINHMAVYLDALEAVEDFVPDLVIVDYLDEMRAVERYAEKRDQLAAITRDLRRFAGERKVPVWTATQANRAATTKKTIRKEDIGESYEKAQVADVIITICQTPEEYHEKRMRLFLAKMRDAAGERTVQAEVDFARGLIRTVGVEDTVDTTRGEDRAGRKPSNDTDERDAKIEARMKSKKRA